MLDNSTEYLILLQLSPRGQIKKNYHRSFDRSFFLREKSALPRKTQPNSKLSPSFNLHSLVFLIQFAIKIIFRAKILRWLVFAGVSWQFSLLVCFSAFHFFLYLAMAMRPNTLRPSLRPTDIRCQRHSPQKMIQQYNFHWLSFVMSKKKVSGIRNEYFQSPARWLGRIIAHVPK